MTKNWNKIAEEYTQRGFGITDWRLGYLPVLGLLGTLQGKKGLDYGCGSGKFTRILVQKDALITAVDPAETMISLAREKETTNIEYHLLDGNKLAFIPSGSLDFAVSTFVFCTIKDLREAQSIITEVFQKLKFGGPYVILDPHPLASGHHYVKSYRTYPKNWQTGDEIEVTLDRMSEPLTDYWKSKDDYLQCLQRAGFKIKTILEPRLGENEDENFWKEERRFPPTIIFQGVKK